MAKYKLKNRGQVTLNHYNSTFVDMTLEQKREYMRNRKAQSRRKQSIKDNESRYRRKYYIENKEKLSLKSKKYRDEHRDEILAKHRLPNPFGNCLPMKMFGCQRKDMTPEQLRQYWCLRTKLYREKRNRSNKNEV